jgi:hypothetical protein
MSAAGGQVSLPMARPPAENLQGTAANPDCVLSLTL